MMLWYSCALSTKMGAQSDCIAECYSLFLPLYKHFGYSPLLLRLQSPDVVKNAEMRS